MQCKPTGNGNTVQFEVEVRGGKVLPDGNFRSSVDAWYFYAVFEALYRSRDCDAGPLQKTTHLCYRGFRRQEIFPEKGLKDDAWTEKSVVEGCLQTHRTCGKNCWFDVRISLAKETSLGSHAARQARAQCDVRAPENGLRTRTRRSLLFPSLAPRWRVDFTHVTTQHPPHVSLPVFDTFEVEFELLPQGDPLPGHAQRETPRDLVDQANRLLARVRDAVAETEAEMRNAIFEQSQRWESVHSF